MLWIRSVNTASLLLDEHARLYTHARGTLKEVYRKADSSLFAFGIPRGISAQVLTGDPGVHVMQGVGVEGTRYIGAWRAARHDRRRTSRLVAGLLTDSHDNVNKANVSNGLVV